MRSWWSGAKVVLLNYISFCVFCYLLWALKKIKLKYYSNRHKESFKKETIWIFNNCPPSYWNVKILSQIENSPHSRITRRPHILADNYEGEGNNWSYILLEVLCIIEHFLNSQRLCGMGCYKRPGQWLSKFPHSYHSWINCNYFEYKHFL